jgi:tetratricopeptide (TPR) repeat protein
MPTVDAERASDAELTPRRRALEEALRLRSNWAEGHLRLGAVMLGLYSNFAERWIGELSPEKVPEGLEVLSDPLWLHGVAHSASDPELAQLGGLQNQQPVRDYLMPAARCFLEARRCSPDLPLAHARLAELDYLIASHETTFTHVRRALRLCGYDHSVLVLAGQAAAQAGDIDLAAQCWQKAVAIEPEAGVAVVVAASMLMTPEEILARVLPPGGRLPLLLADQLYTTPEWRATREQFLRASIDRLPGDLELLPHERRWYEAQARARLGQPERARKLMSEALVDDAEHPEWRAEFIDWLRQWGDLEEASRQARIGLTLHPHHTGLERASQSALDAIARGERRPAGPD